jgi:hypothetical protein
MVLYRSEFSCWWWKNPRILNWIWARAPKKYAPCFRGTRNFLFILFEIFNLVYSSSPIPICNFWDSNLGYQELAKLRFCSTSKPFFGLWPTRDVYLDFLLRWLAKTAAGMLTPVKYWPFEIYLTTTPCFGHTDLGFRSIKSNDVLVGQRTFEILPNLPNFRKKFSIFFKKLMIF